MDVILIGVLGGVWLGGSLWGFFDWYGDRYERRTGRDWTTGEPRES